MLLDISFELLDISFEFTCDTSRGLHLPLCFYEKNNGL